jgi:Tubulin-tyrosine ligase family
LTSSDTCRADVLSVGVDSGFEHSRLTDRQRVNHFPRHMELTRKDLVVKNLKKWRRQMVKAGQGMDELFWPETYALPQEFGMFAEAFKRTGGLWIMKPVGRAQGRGIFMLDRLATAAAWRRANEEREPEKRHAPCHTLHSSHCLLPFP